ncbi:MAG: hypothetical protein F9K24_07010 [Leptonema illini]|uniref:Aspartyl protease n=1 Tax=Leptonema illini TaxID=183 RepID=A0A833H2Y1_9LEPT|nr:MAG: hypothetical protein F9K24_07010 [Leptonema illini]
MLLRRWIRFAVIPFSLAFLTDCSAFTALTVIRSGEQSGALTTPIKTQCRRRGHMMILTVRINDSNKDFNFVLDTGAASVFNTSVAEELKLKAKTALTAKDPTGAEKEVGMVFLNRFAVKDGISIQHVGAAVMDIPPMFERHTGERIDGILGSNILRYFAFILDYSENSVTWLPEGQAISLRTKDAILMKQTLKQGFTPAIPCSIDDTETLCLIDTGSSLPLMVPKSRLTQEKRRYRLIHGIVATKENLFQLRNILHDPQIKTITIEYESDGNRGTATVIKEPLFGE